MLGPRSLPLILAVALCACGKSASSEDAGRGVLVIAVDALRADHLRCAGYDRNTSAALDALAAEGTLFTLTFSASPRTQTAHAALLTGADPLLSQRIFPPNVQPSVLTQTLVTERSPLLARELLGHGWTTAAFVDDPALAPTQGFAQGFGVFQGVGLTTRRRPTDAGVGGVGSRFLQWLAQRSRRESWFAYLHLHDLVRAWDSSDPERDSFFQPRPEFAFVPPVAEAAQAFFAIPRTKWSGGTVTLGEYRARYDGAVRQLDQGLGHLFAQLQRAGRWEDTTVVVVGAHGISFDESCLILDSGTLSDVDLRVPLIVRPAATLVAQRGQVSAALSSTVDVAPTLLDLHGLQKPAGMHGVSLAAVVRGDTALGPRRYAYASCGLQEGWAVFDERWCFEHVYPGRVLDPNLALSWYGDAAPHFDLREVLHDRLRSTVLGHLRPESGADPARQSLLDEVRQRLSSAGTVFYEQVEAQRRLLQAVPILSAERRPP
jgi:arylsulfatase A-like enzyme